MKVVVEKELCTSCGTCWNEMPAIFSHDANMLAEVINPEVPDSLLPRVKNVAQICPGDCIILRKKI